MLKYFLWLNRKFQLGFSKLYKATRHMHMKRKLFLYSIIGIVVLYIFFHLFFPRNERPHPMLHVSAASVVQKDVMTKLQTIGTVQAYSTVAVKSMVTGPLASAGFKEGDVVAQGQVLFAIDQRSFVAALNQARANLARDQATLANHQTQLERNTPLLKKGFVSKQDYDTLIANVKASAATVKADEAALDNAQLQLNYATIRAPIPGKTGNMLFKPGSIIKANDTDALVIINQINPIYVTFSIPSSKLNAIQTNLQRGPLMVDVSLNGRKVDQGQLTFIDNTVDITTGSIQLKATMPNKQRQLWPGQYVTVDLPIEYLKNAVLIPSLALLSGQKGFYVFVMDEDETVHIQDVTPGATIGNDVVIEKGLMPGAKVVTAGQSQLQEGAKVILAQPTVR